MVKTFMKHPGNKTRVLKQLLPLVPKEYGTYYEPFLGSGAMYLAIEPKKAVLNDNNKDVINTWKSIKKDSSRLILLVENLLKKTHDLNLINLRSYSLQLFNEMHKKKFDISRASIYLFLKIVSYGGHLYTKNGHYNGVNALKSLSLTLNKNINLILQTSKLLKNSKLQCKDYKKVIKNAKKGDFVYLDPPYIYDTKNPVVYNTKGEEDILNELKEQMDFLTRKGVYVMLSSSDFSIVKGVFKEYNIYTIKVYRPMRHIHVNELVITNYTN